VGGRAHKHPHAVCRRREDHFPEDPDQGVARATQADRRKPRQEARFSSTSAGEGNPSGPPLDRIPRFTGAPPRTLLRTSQIADIEIHYNRVTLRWWTHTAGGISDRDRELAARTSELV
jgi:hypothetical protein